MEQGESTVQLAKAGRQQVTDVQGSWSVTAHIGRPKSLHLVMVDVMAEQIPFRPQVALS